MKILAVGDIPDPLLHDHFQPERWQGDHHIDVLVSCGDLSAEYLDFLISVFRVPGYYVPGNHDLGYQAHPPPGWDNVDGKVVVHRGIRLAGLGGCMRYTSRDQAYQYTERQMGRRAWRLRFPLWRAGGVDVMVSHAAPSICPVAYAPCFEPAGGGRPCAHPEYPEHLAMCPDAPDLCHQGYLTFRGMIDRFQPRYWLHGHNHLSYSRAKRVYSVGQTSVVNVYSHTIIEVEPRA